MFYEQVQVGNCNNRSNNTLTINPLPAALLTNKVSSTQTQVEEAKHVHFNRQFVYMKKTVHRRLAEC